MYQLKVSIKPILGKFFNDAAFLITLKMEREIKDLRNIRAS